MYNIYESNLKGLDIHAVNKFSEKGLELQTVKNKKLAFLKEMVFRLFFKKNMTQCTDYKGDKICFLKNKNLLLNHSIAYNNAYKSAGDSYWKIEYKTIICLDPIRTFRLLKFILSVRKKNKYKSNGPLYWSLVCSFIIVMDFFNDIKKYDFSRTKLGVVYCDASPVDHIFVHFLKSIGITTATLQHGVSAAPQNINNTYADPGGIIYMNSNADYFLAMNPFSRDEAIKSGMLPKKIKVMGILQYAYFDTKIGKKNRTGVFGVILPGEGVELLETIGKELIEYANFLAQKLNMKYYLKYHPSSLKFKYDDLAQKKYFAGHLPLKMSVPEYVNLVEFTLVSTSTVFMELVFMGHVVYRMCIDDEKLDPYKNIKLNSFKNKEELLHLAKTNNIASEELFYYLCYTKQPEKNYETFFRKFII